MLVELLGTILTFVSGAAVYNNCEKPTTKWDIEACSIKNDPSKFQSLCTPTKVLPNNANSYSDLKNVKGIIIMYHGYTACPDSTKTAAEALQSEGYVVLSPLTVGHGVNRGFSCTNATCVGNLNENPSFLPTNKEEYISWLDWSLEALIEEASLIPLSARDPSFFVGSFGLSLGGALATASASRPKSPIQKVLMANPFYSLSVPALDYKILKCQAAAPSEQNFCLFGKTKFLLDGLNASSGPEFGNYTLLVNLIAQSNPEIDSFLRPKSINAETVFKGYPNFMNNLWKTFTSISDNRSLMNVTLQETPYGWGKVCESTPGRGGYCTTKVKNVLAIHAMGSFAFGQSKNIPSSVKALMMYSERDGFSRDALSSTLISNLGNQNATASMCTYHLSCDLNSFIGSDNTCGVPHSLLSEAENVVIKPFTTYWEDNMIKNIVGFFSDKSALTSDIAGDICSTTPSSFINSFDTMGPTYFDFASKYFSK